VPAKLSQATQRVLALDLLRGYFLFVIIIDHLQRFPDLFDLMTGRGFLWVSAAEGFFFLSGLVVMMVRQRDYDRGGFKAVLKKCWSRAFTLYIWSVLLTMIFTYIAFAVGETHPGIKSGLIGHDSFLEILRDAALFRYTYGWADFLPHYVIFLLGAPFVLWLIRKKLTPAVILVSLLLWRYGSTFEAHWQILFYGGMIGAHYLPAIERWVRTWKPATRRAAGVLIVSSAFVIMFISSLVVRQRPIFEKLGIPIASQLNSYNYLLAPWFSKFELPWPRLLLFGLWFSALYIVFRKFEPQIMRWLGWFFLPYGQNSLYIYIVHSMVLFAIGLLIPFATTALVVNLLISLAVLGLIWFFAKRRLGMGIIPR
jgi:hypothetical protein